MTIHPEFCDLVLFNTTPATTPSPNRISSPVPIASAVKLFMTTPFSRRQGKQPEPPRPGRAVQAHPPSPVEDHGWRYPQEAKIVRSRMSNRFSSRRRSASSNATLVYGGRRPAPGTRLTGGPGQAERARDARAALQRSGGDGGGGRRGFPGGG